MNALKNDTFANKVEKFYLEILKQILEVNKKVNDIKVLAEVGQFPLSINIETQMFKYLQGFPFSDNDRYQNKAFQENNLGTTGWIRNIKNILEFYGQVNHIQNIFKIIEGEISAKMITNLRIRASNCYLLVTKVFLVK